MSDAFTESGMTFPADPDGLRFRIETSEAYRAIKNSGVKMVEFLQLRTEAEATVEMWVVEAKSSTPRPDNDPERFGNFVGEIQEKFTNGFSMILACCLKRHKSAVRELPEKFKHLDLGLLEIRFLLIVRGHKLEWLPPLKDALNNSLRSMLLTWKLGPLAVVVLNDELARKHGLIL